MSSILWTIILVIFLIIEASTVNLVTIWFAVGSLGAIVANLLGANPLWQIITFLCMSAVALIVARPLIKKHITPKHVATNADRIIGETGTVTEEISPDKFSGQVNVSGRQWSAVSEDSSAIAVGTKVKIKEISGVKLIVEKDN